MSIKIIGAEKRGSELFITVEADTPAEQDSPQAKKLAYEDMSNHGFANAGIEHHERFMVDREDGTKGFRRVFRCVQML